MFKERSLHRILIACQAEVSLSVYQLGSWLLSSVLVLVLRLLLLVSQEQLDSLLGQAVRP